MANSALQGLAFGGAEGEEETPPEGGDKGPLGEEHFEERPAPEGEDRAQLERQARAKGWKPKDQYRGKAEWVDAPEYLERAETFLPIVNAQNRQLQGQVKTLQTQLEQTSAALERANAAIDGLEKFRTDSSKAMNEASQEQLIDQIAAAREAGDTRTEIKLSAKLSALMAAPPPTRTTTATRTDSDGTTQRKEPRETPEFRAWVESNEWWTQDPVKRATALALAQRLHGEGQLTGLTQTEALDLIGAETEKYLSGGRAVATRRPKVNGTRPTGTSGTGGAGSPPGWDDIPAADRRAGFEHARKLKLIGEGRTFKTEADWQRDFARSYHKSGTMKVELVEE